MSEREQFEAWAKVRYAKNPHFWLRQIDDGGYSCGMADAAWAAWQVARAQPAITPETGNAPPQGASAITSETVPLLTEQEIVKCLTASGCVGTIKMSYDSGPYEITRTSINADRFARAIEAAVRAKLGAGVPMTREAVKSMMDGTSTTAADMAKVSPEKAAQVMVDLELQVMAHRYLYYVLARPVLPDAAYDALERKARDELSSGSQVHGVGSSLPSSYTAEQVAHARQLLEKFDG